MTGCFGQAAASDLAAGPIALRVGDRQQPGRCPLPCRSSRGVRLGLVRRHRVLDVVLFDPPRTCRLAEALGKLAKTNTIDTVALAGHSTA